MAALGVGEAEEQDCNHILLLPEWPDSLQITLSPLLGAAWISASQLGLQRNKIAPCHLHTRDSESRHAVYTRLLAIIIASHRDAGNFIDFFFLKDENAYALFFALVCGVS